MEGSKEGHDLKNLDGVRWILILIMMMMMKMNILRKSCILKSTSDIIPVSRYAGKLCLC